MTKICDCASPGTHCIHNDSCKYKVPKKNGGAAIPLVTLAIKRRYSSFVGANRVEPNTLLLGRETFHHLRCQLTGCPFQRAKKPTDTKPLTYLGMGVRLVDQENYLAVGLIVEEDKTANVN